MVSAEIHRRALAAGAGWTSRDRTCPCLSFLGNRQPPLPVALVYRLSLSVNQRIVDLYFPPFRLSDVDGAGELEGTAARPAKAALVAPLISR